MDFFAKNKVLIGFVLFILIGLSVWFGVLNGGSVQNTVLTSETAGGSVAVDSDLVQTLLKLRAVSLSGAIFSDPLFQSLQDFGTQIVPEPVGRENPFAPLATSSPGSLSGHPSTLFAPGAR